MSKREVENAKRVRTDLCDITENNTRMQRHVARRSGANIMASLILLLGSLAYIMILAVINGSIGFICAMGVTVFGAMGVAKALGEAIALSYGLIIGLAVGCGVLRGILRYFEQYSNHFIAFKLLAVLRDKIFGALRTLCPAKLESKQKGSIIAMITSDIETLEVFYAHTISPIAIAVLVSTAVFLFVGFVSSWYLALAAVVAYLVIGIVVPMISSSRLKESGVKYRAEFASFNAYFLDSIKGIKDIVLNNAGEEREKEVNKRSELLLKETKKMKHNSTMKQKEYFNCSSYRKKKKATCTSHQITVEAVEHFVLTNLQRVLAFAKDYEQEFLELIQNENEKELRKRLQIQTRELEEADKRIRSLDRIIQNLYEDKICDNLTEERFVKMSQAYEQEQSELKTKVTFLRQELAHAKEQSDNVTRFMRSVRKYTEITELTPGIVREFVQKVVVYQAEKINGRRTQRIDLYFNGVGQILLPVQNKRETA